MAAISRSGPLRSKVAKGGGGANARGRWDAAKLSIGARVIAVESIIADPDQPRKEFDEDELDALARSLKARGQLQAILVRPAEGSSTWFVVDGERRLRAALRAGLETLRADVATDDQVEHLREVQVIANCCRSDLGPVEKALAYRSIMDDRGWPQARLAEELGVNQSSVSRTLAILDLPPDLRTGVASGELPPAVARALSGMADPGTRQALAVEAVRLRWSASQAASAVRGRGGEALDESGPGDLPAIPLGYAPCITESVRGNDHAWRDLGLIEEPLLPAGAIEAAWRMGIASFGQLEARFAEGTNEATFNGHGPALWAALNRAKAGKVGDQDSPNPPPDVDPHRPDFGGGPAGEGRDLPKRVPLTGTISLKPPPKVEPCPPKLYFYLDPETDLEITIEGKAAGSLKKILEALWRLKGRVEREHFAREDGR